MTITTRRARWGFRFAHATYLDQVQDISREAQYFEFRIGLCVAREVEEKDTRLRTSFIAVAGTFGENG